MKLSSCTVPVQGADKTRGFCASKSPLASVGYCSNRYSCTSTCISSSRSILQIILRALL